MTTGADSAGPTSPLSTPAVVQVGGGSVQVVRGLVLLAGGPYILGPAATFACCPNDNLAVHIAMYRAQPGSVLVGDGGGTSEYGLFGELMATDALGHGISGVVVDGTVRDLDDLDRIGLPVRARGAAPAQCRKQAAISVGEPVVVGGAVVHPGDLVLADRDGVAVVVAEHWPTVRQAALDLAEREQGHLDRLGRGERLAEITGLRGLIESWSKSG